MKEEKELIEKKESIFNRIIQKIKSLFKKEEKREAQPIQNETSEEREVRTYTEEERRAIFEKLSEMDIPESPEIHYENTINLEEEKLRIRKLYLDVKNGLVDIDSLSGVDQLMVNKLLKSEIEITKKKLT